MQHKDPEKGLRLSLTSLLAAGVFASPPEAVAWSWHPNLASFFTSSVASCPCCRTTVGRAPCRRRFSPGPCVFAKLFLVSFLHLFAILLLLSLLGCLVLHELANSLIRLPGTGQGLLHGTHQIGGVTCLRRQLKRGTASASFCVVSTQVWPYFGMLAAGLLPPDGLSGHVPRQ